MDVFEKSKGFTDKNLSLKKNGLASSGMLSAQTITIDTTVPGNPAPENSILEYWYWAYGISITGGGFTANAAIKFTAVDPQGDT